MISVSGIRGIVGEGLSPDLMVRFSAAAGMFYGRGRVMVGRDSRVTGEMVKHAVFSGLMAVGCDPVDLGICSTPTVETAVKNSDAVGGIIITASHNPVEWNALKLLSRHGIFLDESEGMKVKSLIDNQEIQYIDWSGIGTVSSYDKATDDHINTILNLDFIDVEKIRERRFKVAYDCVNGAGGTILPKLFEALGCETYPLNVEPSGRFAHTPEPVPQNLTDLCIKVKEKKADIGFAVDPDVDRCAIIDEHGNPIGEEYTVVLAAGYILEKRKGPVVVNISTTRAIEDVTRQAGVELYRTKVGEIHVVKKMMEVNASVGGEGNGGLILPDIHLGRDAPLAAAVMLQALADKNQSVSEMYNKIPRYEIVKKKVEIGYNDPDEILDKLKKMFDKDKMNLIDGIKIEEEKYWVQVRKSNTEPIIRIMAEAGTQTEAESVCDELLSTITTLIKE